MERVERRLHLRKLLRDALHLRRRGATAQHRGLGGPFGCPAVPVRGLDASATPASLHWSAIRDKEEPTGRGALFRIIPPAINQLSTPWRQRSAYEGERTTSPPPLHTLGPASRTPGEQLSSYVRKFSRNRPASLRACSS